MIRTSSHRLLYCVSLVGVLLSPLIVASPSAHAQWTAPTAEELSMTTQPEVPGAPAVYLFREETTDDHLHMFSIYIRLKVLTERGKEFANVELPYTTGHAGRSVEDIAGRTIHPDGTIIPFVGKPYQKLVEKTQGTKFMTKVFTLPDVGIGSIIEYRYKLYYDDMYYFSPQWYIQSELWTRKGHYVWLPIDLNGNKNLIGDHGERSNTISWTWILPPGNEVKQSRLPGGYSDQDGHTLIELNVHDIPPAPDEEFMPPIHSFTYRVLFYYSAYKTTDEFWKSEGKFWAKSRDKFIGPGPGPGVSAAVRDITAPSDTQEQKLRKLYAAVMRLENTDYTREHSTVEEKAEGFKEVHTTDDIWSRKRGSSDQLAALFVAMARSAGMKAWLIAVTNRDRHIFYKNYLNLSQLDDDLAIVSVDGQDQFFDPGSRYCPYQHLAWKHSMSNGLRQTDGGSELVETPRELYTFSRTQRVANLTMDQQGEVTGTVKMTFMGSPALDWRQHSLTGDATSLERELRASVENTFSQGMDVKVISIEKLDDYEQPLIVNFGVKGAIGSSTGKRLLIPADLFEVSTRPSFPHETREVPVSFSYPNMVQDAIRINFPATLSVESLPANDATTFQTFAGHDMTTTSTATSVSIRRNFVLGEILYMPNEYPDLRAFYSKMETKDQESVVLITTPVATGKPTPAGN
jgi:Domain of Unknown Function with PDB structure (DUF3857)/Transglutaminase-like superfamily